MRTIPQAYRDELGAWRYLIDGRWRYHHEAEKLAGPDALAEAERAARDAGRHINGKNQGIGSSWVYQQQG